MEHSGTVVRQQKRFALKRHFSLASLLCTALIAVLLGWSYQFFALRDLKLLAESRNIALTNAFANALWPQFSPLLDNNADASADVLRRIATDRGLDNLVAQHMKGTGVVKAKVYALNGMTVFSSEPSQTGENKNDNPGFLGARDGTVISALVHRDTLDTFEGSMTDLDIISSYLPVRNAQQKIVGVIEIYSDVTRFLDDLEHTRLIVIGIVAGLLTALYGALYLLVARAQGILDLQSHQLENSLTHVEQANRELDRRVQERTASLNETNQRLTEEIETRRTAEAQLRLSAEVFENATESIVITDAGHRILKVNSAFTRTTGYAAEEVVGLTPRILRSDSVEQMHLDAAMWASLEKDGQWQGELLAKSRTGEEIPGWISIKGVLDERGKVTHHVSIMSDLSQRKAAEKRIDHLAFYDQMTGLPNRQLLIDRLKQALATHSRHQREGALLSIDLDNFKTVNDSFGHEEGDLLLKCVAERLTACIREGDTAARVGGDEFVVMLEDLSENAQEAANQAKSVGKKIQAALNQTYLLAGQEHRVTASIGITLFNGHQETVEDLLQRADLAMSQAKQAGRSTLRFFDPDVQAAVSARAAMERELRKAIDDGQFVLFYQPQVDATSRIVGAEALLRWRHPERGLVPPGDFIPLTEETGLIIPIGQWILKCACDQLAAWALRAELAHLNLSVNVSARQFHHADFSEQVLAAVAHSGANPARLKLELTESLLVEDAEHVITRMTRLKNDGIGFSLDDFGTGYSSLAYLKRLPLDQLKIDQGFVKDLLTNPDDVAITRTIIALAENLGLTVIAEGVEHEAQRDILLRQGCQTYQGFLFSRPVPIDAFEILCCAPGQLLP